MKAKKLTLLLAGLLSVTALSACTDSDKRVDWNNYWKYDSLAPGEAVDETLTYEVTFKEETGLDGLLYALTYGVGSYVTTLKTATDTTQYTYTSELTMPVSYEYEGEKAEFTDKVSSTITFKDAGNGLRPVSSSKTVVSHTPANIRPSKLEDCYSAFEYTITTNYTEDGKGSAVVNEKDAEGDPIAKDFTYGNGDYSYLDNEQLLLALRAVPANTSSGTVESYNPFLKTMQRVNFNFDAKTGGEFSHTVNGNALASKDISYRPVRIQLNAKNPGATQTAWIAATETPGKNVHRNVMLYLETPLFYSIGTFQYTLTSMVHA